MQIDLVTADDMLEIDSEMIVVVETDDGWARSHSDSGFGFD